MGGIGSGRHWCAPRAARRLPEGRHNRPRAELGHQGPVGVNEGNTRPAITSQLLVVSDQRVDRRDVELLRSVRFDLPKGTRVRLDHQRGETEPLLWLADIIAGAVRATQEGRTTYREVLADRLTLVSVDC